LHIYTAILHRVTVDTGSAVIGIAEQVILGYETIYRTLTTLQWSEFGGFLTTSACFSDCADM
jgi:hypothetical protein